MIRCAHNENKLQSCRCFCLGKDLHVSELGASATEKEQSALSIIAVSAPNLSLPPLTVTSVTQQRYFTFI